MKTRRSPFILILCMAGCLLGSRPLTLHDFHASVTQMQYNAKERVFEISVRVFTDDFEKALSEDSNTKVQLAVNDKNDSLIEKYIRPRFAYVNPQKQAKPINYVGHEIEADANWLYLEMPYTEPFRGGLLKQVVLMEMFDDQVNMVNITYQGQKKTFVFRKNQPIQDVSF
ncbi:DUF6702 family protein [Spirosoma soli]|uniref:DUF6702 family protein n=1 Tax=Spirosoma soli TaxID=1770529 RepID=A0ABW5M7C6_9BACT